MLRISRDQAETFAAARVVAMHTTGDGCAQCDPDGECRLWHWADQRLRQWEADQGPLPRDAAEHAPAWTGA